MARPVVAGIVAGRPSILLFLTLTTTAIRSSHAFDLLSRSSSVCPSSYEQCGSTKLPDDFCCPSSFTCISLDNASSAICCPPGRNCNFISPIVCDVNQQNPAINPKNAVKTTRLNDTLPQCGGRCCPFGYTCQNGNTCVLDQNTASTATAALPEFSTSTTSSTTSSSSSSSSTTSSITSSFSSSSTTTTTNTAHPTTSDTTTNSKITNPQSTTTLSTRITKVPSPSSKSNSLNANSATANPQQTYSLSQCPSFPSKAVVAGFFPGAIFGGIAAALISLCVRRRTQRHNEIEIQDPKPGPHWSERSSSGALIGISNPIPSEDVSCRTDFLLRRPAQTKRSSISGRSMLQRTGSRVRSLFSAAKPDQNNLVPPVPESVTPPRQPSTESIKVYSPPGAFAQSTKFLGPEPYPGAIARPDTTFTDLMQVVGFNDKGKPCYRVDMPVPDGKKGDSRK